MNRTEKNGVFESASWDSTPGVGQITGVISYVAIKLGMGKADEPGPIMYGIAVFVLMFYLGPGDQSTFGWLFSTIF